MERFREHFFKHGKDQTPPSETASCHWCQIRGFTSHKRWPITIVNEVDDTVLPPKFRFIEESILGHGVTAAEASFHSGCQCSDDNDCRYRDCLCLQDQFEDEQGTSGRVGRNGRIQAHAYRTGKHAGLLRDKMLLSRLPIYECHEACSCSDKCPNRVVERGREIPLQIFRTEHTGWGVRSPVDIKKGQFIDKYVGEIITHREANRRRRESVSASRKDVYLFALDKFADPDSDDARLRGPPLEVDGEWASGPTRFINHSCNPNLRIFARVGDHVDRPLHDLAFFAVRDIRRGDELTFDYVDGIVDDDDAVHDPQKRKDMVPCLCGERNCRRWLW